jgi:acetolactate synthase I/II/III large subunit
VTKLRVHTALVRSLADHGVTVVSGVQGDANLLFVDDIFDDARVRYISASNEAGAVLMADGYARATGNLGVATVTRGPGLTNTVTALSEAVRNRTPLLLVAGDTDHWRHFQNIDQRAVVLPTGAGFHDLRSQHTALEDLSIAVHRSYREQRPVVLSIPRDLNSECLDTSIEIPSRPKVPVLAPDADSLDAAVGLMASSRRPIILAGRGAVRANARKEIVELARSLGAPLATTLLAKDFFQSEPLNIGIFGTLSSSIAAELITQADCVISFGASLNEMTTFGGDLLTWKRTVQCDIDASRIGYSLNVDSGVVGDARIVAEEMSTWLAKLDYEPSTAWTAQLIGQLQSDSYGEIFKDLSDDKSVDPRTFTSRLSPMLPDNWMLVTDGGRCMKAPWTYLKIDHPDDFLSALNYGSIGLSMGVAIGAQIGAGRPTVAAMGDGGFMLGGLAEFNTAVRHGADLIVIVYNDGCYGSEASFLQSLDRDIASSMISWPDFAPIAEALGGTGITVRCLNDMATVEKAISNRDRPVLIDVKVSPDVSAHLRKL